MSWATIPLKRIAVLTAGGTPAVGEPTYWSDGDEGHAWVSISDMSSVDSVTTTTRRVSDAGLASARIALGDPGTLLFSMYASLGHTAWLSSPAAWNQAILGLRSDSTTDARFLRYSLVSLRSTLLEQARSNTQSNLNAEQVGNLPIPRPPLDVQRRVADFLDAETSLIDGMVALRERQMELLIEAGVSRVFATIRGEHVLGDRKDSGLPWLGSVPKEWPVAAVSHHFDVDLGKMLNPERSRGDHLRPYLRVANVQWGEISTEELLQMDFPPEDWRRYALRAGDLLVCEGGSWPGRAAIWDGSIPEIYYQKALHRLRPRGIHLTQWLYYCLLAAERMSVFAVQGNSSTMTHLTREQLRPQRFPFPDIEVQRSAVTELDAAAVADGELKRALTKQLTLLAERRQALITAAVTGQLDVTTARPAHDRDL
ncbi:restriction endonuclease subunit S [Streptomyces sp. NPDC001728]|uniref:restriction endonuclease subunit S n=1 Tax=Streptomyces sp. NPDC001728 TaxID=3154396 RepID=UPI003333CBD6